MDNAASELRLACWVSCVWQTWKANLININQGNRKGDIHLAFQRMFYQLLLLRERRRMLQGDKLENNRSNKLIPPHQWKKKGRTASVFVNRA